MKELTIIPLGTVSPYAKDNSNLPGFLVRYGNEKILLDCGSGISRLVKVPEVLENLHIVITHLHKDHIGEVGTFQYASYVYHNLGLLNDKIEIFLPFQDKNLMFNKFSIIYNKESYSEYYDIFDGYSFNVNDLKVSFYDNNSHSAKSYVVKMENEDFKVIYTSDIGTSNLDELAKYCESADLIICESSLLKKYNIQNSSHMTAYDAGVLASRSNAKMLMLTHFWPEEDKRLYLEEAKSVFDNVIIAEENKKLLLRR